MPVSLQLAMAPHRLIWSIDATRFYGKEHWQQLDDNLNSLFMIMIPHIMLPTRFFVIHTRVSYFISPVDPC